MCGIVGAVAERNITRIMLEGLRRLEYRGYDSAGMAVINENKQIQRLRALGKVEKLAEALQQNPLSGHTGIAHTRWATHGAPAEKNAHPHVSNERVAVVHNGIIENHEDIRKVLQEQGYQFESETDTEVIAHLVHHYLEEKQTLHQAVLKAVEQVEGAYALAVMDREDPEKIVVARHGSPLVVGLGIGENFVASDHLALLPVTNRILFLEEGDTGEITREKVKLFDQQGREVERKIHEFDSSHEDTDKGEYRHYMQKEIFEQPMAIQKTLDGRLTERGFDFRALGAQGDEWLKSFEQIQIVACGTSYHAGLVAKYWFEAIAELPCQVEVASEFRYRKWVVPDNALFITISQSGETADTLAALRAAKKAGFQSSLAICNVPASSLVRESDRTFMTLAGPEIGVASTKAFTTQLVSLLMLVLAAAEVRGKNPETRKAIVKGLRQLPSMVERTLQLDEAIEKVAAEFSEKHHTLFLGRGTQYPVAMEGSLKLKEISYIHAEAYPAGELKHGPLALVDEEMPIVAIAPNDELLDKLKSNLQEVLARGGKLFVFADKHAGMQEQQGVSVTHLPHVPDVLAPVVYTIPLQLLAYHVALIKGTDVDQPRNLAKSVTVE